VRNGFDSVRRRIFLSDANTHTDSDSHTHAYSNPDTYADANSDAGAADRYA
jgi:hypothetical protein